MDSYPYVRDSLRQQEPFGSQNRREGGGMGERREAGERSGIFNGSMYNTSEFRPSNAHNSRTTETGGRREEEGNNEIRLFKDQSN